MTQVGESLATSSTSPPAASTPVAPAGRSRWLALLATPELTTVLLLVAAVAYSWFRVEGFADASFLLDQTSLFVETGLMAVAMTFVIVGGHIDLSCSAILALTAAVVATVYNKWNVRFEFLIAAAPLFGALLGAINGVIVAKLKLPSLVVTLATMAIFRGLAQVLIGDHSAEPPDWFKGIDLHYLFHGKVPVPLVILTIASVLGGLVLHRTIIGRWVFAMGTNPQAARYSGVPVAKMEIGAFVLSGVLSAVAGLVLMSRLGVARYDMAVGTELDVITAVVLGGASIFGGRGTLFGTITAVALVGTIQTAMLLKNVDAPTQLTASGGLLIFAVLSSNALGLARRRR
jgi:rhamnose transport system permease protein